MHYTTLYLLNSSVYFHRCKFFWIVNISFSRNFPNLEICEQYFTQSLRMCMSAWTPVMDKMLVCKPIQYLQTICSSCAQKIYSLTWPDTLSHRAFIACSISART